MSTSVEVKCGDCGVSLTMVDALPKPDDVLPGAAS